MFCPQLLVRISCFLSFVFVFLQKGEVGTRGKNKIADFQTSLHYAKNGWLKWFPEKKKVGQDALNFS